MIRFKKKLHDSAQGLRIRKNVVRPEGQLSYGGKKHYEKYCNRFCWIWYLYRSGINSECIIDLSITTPSKNQTGLTASAVPIIVAGMSWQAGTANGSSKYF